MSNDEPSCIERAAQNEQPFYWCGKSGPTSGLGREWAFVNANHALNSICSGDGLTVCPDCLDAIITVARYELNGGGIGLTIKARP